MKLNNIQLYTFFYSLSSFISSLLHLLSPRGGSGEGLLPLRKNRPQVSPACRKRRSKRGDSFAVSRDPCQWRKRSWCHEDIWVAGVSHLPNTALWLLLHLDGRLGGPAPINRLVMSSPRNLLLYRLCLTSPSMRTLPVDKPFTITVTRSL